MPLCVLIKIIILMLLAADVAGFDLAVAHEDMGSCNVEESSESTIICDCGELNGYPSPNDMKLRELVYLRDNADGVFAIKYTAEDGYSVQFGYRDNQCQFSSLNNDRIIFYEYHEGDRREFDSLGGNGYLFDHLYLDGEFKESVILNITKEQLKLEVQ